jgi:plastocyanin
MMISKGLVASLMFAFGVVLSCGGGGSDGTNGAGGSPGAGATSSGGSGGAAGQTGASCLAAGTLNVTARGSTAYVIDGVSNPSLTLCRGSTYTFAIDTPGHPFYVKTVQSTGTADAYDSGVTGNGTTSGNLTFVVPLDAPATLYYICSLHAAMIGTINLVDGP